MYNVARRKRGKALTKTEQTAPNEVGPPLSYDNAE